MLWHTERRVLYKQKVATYMATNETQGNGSHQLSEKKCW